jgi:hypothetical protein
MISTSPKNTPRPTSAWELIQSDFTLRLSLVAHEWAAEHLAAWNAVFVEGRKRGNAGYAGPALVEMEIADADKRAEWSYQTCCEIWEIQGQRKSRLFFRAVFDSCLQPMFTTREGCFRHELELHRKRTLGKIAQDLSAIAGHMKREMNRLRAKWNTKLEIAARDNEHQQKQQQIHADEIQQGSAPAALAAARTFTDLLRPPNHLASEVVLVSSGELLPATQVYAVASSFTWKELESRFREIQMKPPMRDRVSAEFIRTEWDSGSNTEEWNIRGDSVCRTEFERVARIAARKLGYAGNEDAIKYWLDRVREWLLLTGLDKNKDVTWCPTGEGSYRGNFHKTTYLITERIAELSAMYCVELMAQGAPESTVSLSLEQQGIADRESRSGRIKRKVNRTKTQLQKTAVVFGAIQLGLKGRKYCALLDARKTRLPDRWREEGCPDTYMQAYRDAYWQKRIHDEKYRFQEQYDKTPLHEREAIIQGESGTRHTRS